VKDEEVEEVLEKASRVAHEVEPALLKRVAHSIHSSLRPVRPLPPTWVLTVGLVLISAAVALGGAARTGFHGIEKLGLLERVLIFSTLGILAWIAGKEFVGELIPGSRHRVRPGVLLIIVSVALLGVFALLFRNYRTHHFISAGIGCLLTGLLLAIPAAFLSWLLLRRGFAVNAVSAGLVGGALAGLCGVTMLELHCVNFEALHVLVWHIAVVPVSAAAGALVGWALRSRRKLA
jgi:negative regulator of sigma F NrsF-like protein